MDFIPDHEPDAVHDVVLVDDHDSVDDEPVVMADGEDERVMVGTGTGGGGGGIGPGVPPNS